MKHRFGLRWFLLPVLFVLFGTSVVAYSYIFESSPQVSSERIVSSIQTNDRFRNAKDLPGIGFVGGVKALWRNLTEKSALAQPNAPLDVVPLAAEDLHEAPDRSLWRLGHSTVLLKLDGKFWLTDPVFAERVSPVGFAGPRRFHAAPITPDALPPIEAVILSHDHYDHLDRETVLAIQEKVGVFLAPLGVGDRLIDWGIPAAKVRQLDWWEETQVGALRLIATPAQHFSGRSLTDGNSTLWASWVLIAPQGRIFFSGDSGYFAGFKAIGERFGPFDVTLIENGAYNEAWADIHMQPAQTVQAHIDLRGKWLVPIHNGTFDLALHAWTDPMERVAALAARSDIQLGTPRFGERFAIDEAERGYAWWRTDPVTQNSVGENPAEFAGSENPQARNLSKAI